LTFYSLINGAIKDWRPTLLPARSGMERNTSESDQDGGITSGGEDSSFERSNAPSASGRQSASGGGNSSSGRGPEGDSQQQNSQMQPQYRAAAASAAAASGMDSQSQAAMMMSANYLPFMMSTSYPGMMMPGGVPITSAAGSQAAAAASFFNQLNQNSLAKDGGAVAAAGSPLNLQTQQQQQQRSMPSASPGAQQQQRNSPHPTQGSSAYPQPAHQGGAAAYGSGGQMAAPGRFPEAAKPGAPGSEYPPQPKRPLTPYMRFNKFMWEKVKSSNPSIGVCEISAAIGRLWRELGPEEKQRHNNEYTLDKARYDEELKAYLKLTGLRSSDLIKKKAPKPTKPAPAAATPPVQQQVRRPAAAPAPQQPSQAARSSALSHEQQHAQAAANHHHQQQQQLQALMGLNMGAGSLPIGMPVGFQNMGMLSGFPQMWAAAGQQYPGGLVAAGQLQELYGGVNGIEAPPPAHNQQPSGADVQASTLYRYPQSFM
jgi:hypothetical protein